MQLPPEVDEARRAEAAREAICFRQRASRPPWARRLAPVALILIVVVFLFPVFWMLLTSFKLRRDVFAQPPMFLFNPTLDNYRTVLTSEFVRHLLNSFIIAGSSTILSVGLGAMCAYGFSRYGRFRGSEQLLFWILSLRMLPPIAAAVPFALLLRWTGLHDTHIALALIYSIFNISLSVWLLKGFFDEIPPEMEESAMLEGHSPPAVFWRVSLPLARSGIAAAAALCLIFSLNEFLLALLLTEVRAVTAPVGLTRFESFGLEWGQFAAAAMLFIFPVVVFTFVVRRSLVRGMSFGRMA
jgi:ABC-type glycerol-3-phosphate transport system permease component